jgi:2-hydroxycyclohexanecarboxyl-CoA dehydrogenase
LNIAEPFSGQVALLTGATSGIGLETAAQLAELGVGTVILNGRSMQRGDTACAIVRARAPGCQVLFVQGDASETATVTAMVAAAKEAGALDVLVNAVPGASSPRPFEQIDPDDILPLMQAHLLGTLLPTRALLPLMIARGGGTVLIVSSDAAKIPTPGESVHGALMAALDMFGRTLALECVRHKIRVHILTPSLVGGTISHQRMMADPFSAKLFEKAAARAVLGLPEPADLARLAVFLASPAAARMTGQSITINGGLAVA